MALEAADDGTFWYTNPYDTTTAAFGWSTQLASIKFPNGHEWMMNKARLRLPRQNRGRTSFSRL
jgi:hypothetical protein